MEHRHNIQTWSLRNSRVISYTTLVKDFIERKYAWTEWLLSLYAAVTYQRVQPSAPEKVKTLGSRLLPTKASTGCSFSGCGRHIMGARASLAHRCFEVRHLSTKLTFGRKINMNQKKGDYLPSLFGCDFALGTNQYRGGCYSVSEL